ncbi:MAG: hypothetical protein LBR06_01745 [Bacteroidales bacterium]|jgi:hypothetical protein|nr:hypothetical protein [Bacteroidales bacterium]
MKEKILIATMILGTLGLVSCTKTDDPISSSDEKSYTNATFVLPDIDITSKAEADFDGFGNAPDDADDRRLVASDLKLLIFDATTGVLEKKADFTSVSGTPNTGTVTVLTYTGQKKIFVVGNVSQLIDVNPATGADAATTFTTKYSSLTEGASTVSDFKAMAFDAGGPQLWSINKASSSRTWKVNHLATQASGSQGLPVSSNDDIIYTLAPGVTAANSQTGTPSQSGTSSNNHFSITMKMMSARARLAVNTAALTGPTVLVYDWDNPSTSGINFPFQAWTITNMTWTLKNLPKYASYIEWVLSSKPTSYYYDFSSAQTNPAHSDYASRFDTGNNINTPLLSAASATAAQANTTAPYLFAPDNLNQAGNSIQRGQSTFYIVKAKVTPKRVAGELWGVDGVGAYYFGDNWATTWGSTSYVYLRKTIGKYHLLQQVDYKAGTTDLGTYNFFRSVEFLEWVWYMDAHPERTYSFGDPAIHTLFTTEVVNTIGGGDPNNIYWEYGADQYQYWRLDVGEGNFPGAINYGVKRGVSYNGWIETILSPGAPSEDILYEHPEAPVTSSGFLTGAIEVKPWVLSPEIISGVE